MSVETTLALPDQPAVGAVEVMPLAGDGLYAPQSLIFAQMTTTGDASGGHHYQKIQMELEHQHMLYYVSAYVDAAAADVVATVNFQWGINAKMQTAVDMRYSAVTGQALALWRPIPAIAGQQFSDGAPPSFAIWVPNVDGQNLQVNLGALQFVPGARSRSPFPLLSANYAS